MLELGATELQVQVLRARLVGRDVRQVDVGTLGGRELDLRLLGRLAQALHRHRIVGQIQTLVLLELGHEVLDDALVEVVTSQVRIPVRRLDLDDVLADLEDGDVEGAATEIEDRDLLFALLVEARRPGQRPSAH